MIYRVIRVNDSTVSGNIFTTTQSAILERICSERGIKLWEEHAEKK